VFGTTKDFRLEAKIELGPWPCWRGTTSVNGLKKDPGWRWHCVAAHRDHQRGAAGLALLPRRLALGQLPLAASPR